MNKLFLKDITLVGIDCLDIDRLIFAAEICRKHIEFESVKLFTSLSSDNEFIVRINSITNREEYSYFVMKELSKFIETKYILIIQWDGFILNPFNWNDDFLNFDYIGAPWWYNDEFNVGNGGFSLRSKRLMEALSADNTIEEHHPEDHVICRVLGENLKKQGFKFADEKTAIEFSVENQVWDQQFGFHNTNIAKWDIHQFAHPEKHKKYIDLFYKYFR